MHPSRFIPITSQFPWPHPAAGCWIMVNTACAAGIDLQTMEWLCRATNRATAQPPSAGLPNTSGQGHITLLSAEVKSCS